jgi:LemA protein
LFFGLVTAFVNTLRHRVRFSFLFWCRWPGLVPLGWGETVFHAFRSESGTSGPLAPATLPLCSADSSPKQNVTPAMVALIVVLVLVILLIVFTISLYNRLIRLRNRYKNAFAQIDVQLKRRYDLIPNLVEVAKGYMKHERETLEAVIEARNQASRAEQRVAADPGDPEALKGLMGAERALTGTLGRFFALSEAYPDLKANQNMMQLQEELATTENKIAFARQSYNDAVMRYNTGRETFPAVLIAEMFNFDEAALFETEAPEERTAPRVSF